MDERNCKECAHYVVRSGQTYSQADCAATTTIVWGCDAWECKFKAKNKDRNGEEKS